MKDDLEAQVSAGLEAKEILNHPQFKSAVLRIKADLLERFESSTFKEREERDEIWRKLQSLNAVLKDLEQVITTGKLSEQTLLEKVKSKFRE